MLLWESLFVIQLNGKIPYRDREIPYYRRFYMTLLIGGLFFIFIAVGIERKLAFVLPQYA